MYHSPRGNYGLLLFVSLWAATHLTGVVVKDTEDVGQSVYCPSYCDDLGFFHTGKYCLVALQPYCCLVKDQLNCCSNKTSSVNDGVKDNYNCLETHGWFELYWKTILGVCLTLAMISVVGAVTLCSIQNKRTKRRQRQLAELERDRSNSAISSISGNSSCSRTTLGPPPSPIVIVSSRHSSPNLEDLRLNGLRFPLQPPPYTADKPPKYSEITLDLEASFDSNVHADV